MATYKLTSGVIFKNSIKKGDETFGIVSDGKNDYEIPLTTFVLMKELQKGPKTIDELVQFQMKIIPEDSAKLVGAEIESALSDHEYTIIEKV